MSNTVFLIIDVCTLLVLGGLLFLSHKLKKKNKGKQSHVSSLQQAYDFQDKVIYHTSQAILITTYLLRNISEMMADNLLPPNIAKELSQAFEEVSNRVRGHINQEIDNYQYSLIIGDCFNDTENCLLVLNKIVKECGGKDIREIIHNFKATL